jgi:urocanate hydratase
LLNKKKKKGVSMIARQNLIQPRHPSEVSPGASGSPGLAGAAGLWSREAFARAVLEGIPSELPPARERDPGLSHAPKRKKILSAEERKLALRNALRYFEPKFHKELAGEFARELELYGRIYMYRFRPEYPIRAYPIDWYPAKSRQAAAILLMLMNNLDPAVAQHPEELITYGGNGAVFQNWAQYRLALRYLATMTDEQTLVLYSGHPLGLFPSHPEAPRVVVTNGLMIPNYSKPDDWERYNALGVTQYGQMTAGSFMYIGPQGIVHGTTITVLNAGRRLAQTRGETVGEEGLRGRVFVTAGLGGMSGAQARAAVLAGAVGVVAEVNEHALFKRHRQGWVDEVFTELDPLLARMQRARASGEAVSLAYRGNVVDLWEKLAASGVSVDLGSDQTSLHNPWAGGYYPVGLSLEESNRLMAEEPAAFRERVRESLRRQAAAIGVLSTRGMYFFDYGNAFLLEAGRAGADVLGTDGGFRYPSYVEDILGPLCFDHGFGPFRWVCASGKPEDLDKTDAIAAQVLRGILARAPAEIVAQLEDNLRWIEAAKSNRLVVGSQARILYADAEGRVAISRAFNEAIARGELAGPVVLGRDHHDVSGTDSPYRETADIRDGSRFTADMAVHNFVGDAFRGATWVSLHNGGGVGFGEVINGGFGLVLDGSPAAERRLESMLFWDVNNGIARRSWARNPGAVSAIRRAMEREPRLRVTVPQLVDDSVLESAFPSESRG